MQQRNKPNVAAKVAKGEQKAMTKKKIAQQNYYKSNQV